VENNWRPISVPRYDDNDRSEYILELGFKDGAAFDDGPFFRVQSVLSCEKRFAALQKERLAELKKTAPRNVKKQAVVHLSHNCFCRFIAISLTLSLLLSLTLTLSRSLSLSLIRVCDNDFQIRSTFVVHDETYSETSS
jgi:hypothetical protein